MTIASYATLNPRDCQKSYYLRTNTNRPNFYIRMLNGLSLEQYSFDGEGEGGLKAMTVHHLEQAKQVLLAFDVVLFLEEDAYSQNMKLQKLTGRSTLKIDRCLSFNEHQHVCVVYFSFQSCSIPNRS